MNKRSYAELFFEQVLKNNGIFDKCIPEYEVSRKDLGELNMYFYFLDFYFPDKKIDLEIDGAQHKYRKDSDNKRDDILKKHGYIVYRIEWKNPNTESTKQYIKEEIDKFLEFYNSI
jgi:very-short-patch-repair endonuclease